MADMRIVFISSLVVWLVGCGGREAPLPSTDPTSPSPPARPPGTSPPPAMPPPPSAGPSRSCPAFVPAPTDCGPWATACAGARPLAVGTFARISRFALGGESLYWSTDATDLAPCGGTIYRTPTAGGMAAAVASTSAVVALGADATALYWISPDAGLSVEARASDGTTRTLATFAGGSPFGLGSDATGVVLFGETTVAVLRPGRIELVPGGTPWLASEPAYDGASVVASKADGTLVRWEAATGVVRALATGAATRSRRTVVIAGTDVFFVVGDEETDGMGMQPRPMGILRVPIAGGVTMTIVPPAQQHIDTLAFDDTRIYFAVGKDIRAVPRAGGSVVTVATLGAEPRDLHVHAGGFYFRLDVGGRRGELTAPGAVIATLPTGS